MFALNAFVRIPFPFAFQLSRESTPASRFATSRSPPLHPFSASSFIFPLLATLSSVVSPIYNPREWLLATRIRRVLHEGSAGEGEGEETYVHCPFVRNFRGIENSPSVCRLATDEANEDEENRLGTIPRKLRGSFSSGKHSFLAFFSSFSEISFQRKVFRDGSMVSKSKSAVTMNGARVVVVIVVE